ncbi:response regulator transcription factor [Sphingobacterium sp. N143]|uniref:LytR/AlgR family response regulator transcription factor n=1 Tax=Sphingobacterium sp. N143 TaxID=2746727 RepID=UPI0025774221|nr:LytTR family DNA-binding domain-containing protein [Sphingobacterium sp. N143]MDM1296824.1 response regulator transcription factor [Sphingobacterium sp. N143]
MPIIPILIVEDYLPDADRLKELLRQTALDLIIDMAHSQEEALEKIRLINYDIIFMDVVLGGANKAHSFNGMDLYEAIDPKKKPEVVFVTEHESFSLRSYNLNASDFMHKPATYPKVCRALNNAFLRLAVPINIKCIPEPESAFIEMSDRICYKVQFCDVYFIQKVKGDNEVVFFERNTEIDQEGYPRPRKARKTIKEVLSFLPKSSFLQVDQSNIVNIDFIKSIKGDLITMIEGPQKKFKVTRNFIKELREKLHIC